MTTTDPQTETQTEPLEFCSIEEDTWMYHEFPTAVPFPDGGLPLFAMGTLIYLETEVTWFLFLDGNGGGMLFDNDPVHIFGGCELLRTFSGQAEAEAWFRAQVGVPDSEESFLRAGFRWTA